MEFTVILALSLLLTLLLACFYVVIFGWGETTMSGEGETTMSGDSLSSSDVNNRLVEGQKVSCDGYENVFPWNEANVIRKPYRSSVSQCHLTTVNATACRPMIQNVRWKEPLSEIHVYDIDHLPDKGPEQPCQYSLR